MKGHQIIIKDNNAPVNITIQSPGEPPRKSHWWTKLINFCKKVSAFLGIV